MTEALSLQSKAEKVRAFARVEADKAGESEARGRTISALTALDQELDQVTVLLDTMGALSQEGIFSSPNRDQLRRRGQELLTKIDTTGRPSYGEIRGAMTTLQNERKRQQHESREAWDAWASEQRSCLSTENLPLLSTQDRSQANAYLKYLQDYQQKEPTSDTVHLFINYLARLTELLDSASADRTLSEALRLLDRTPAPTLSDFTDEQVAALRAHEDVAKAVILTQSRRRD